MKILQDILDSQIQEQLSFHKIGTRLIEKKFSELGVILTNTQLTDIESRLLNLQSDTITLTLNIDDQLLSQYSEETLRNVLSIDLSDSEKDIDLLLKQLTGGLSEAIPEITEELSDLLLKQLKHNAPSMLKNHKKGRESFETHHIRTWHKPLELLEMFIVIAREAGDDFNCELRAEATEKSDYVFDALTRLHARACQVASEILVLLRAGYADGAHARWRSLHEIAVVGFFIQSTGNEIAEKYLLYDAIESYKAAQQYQKYCEALGYEPISEKELSEIKLLYDHLRDRFGSSYTENYGWAASVIGKNPTIGAIEQRVELDHLRPFYKMASYNVHATPKGIHFRLGLSQDQETLLAGPSNMGLADPGHSTAISLGQITLALLTTRPSIDSLVICKILTKLIKEIGEEFLAVQKSIENSED